MVGILHYLNGYFLGIFRYKKPRYVIRDGLLYGIYRDKKKKEHRVKLICPHMKCFLIFNDVDKTWDCPCHGLRFDIDGNLITGLSFSDVGYFDK